MTDEEILAMDRRASPPAPAVAVKPLEWSQNQTDPTAQKARSILGLYEVWASHTEEGVWCWTGYNEGGHAPGPSIDDAKAAAQADYEQRIRSALVEPAQAVAVPEDVEDLLERLDGGVRISGEEETDDGVIERVDVDDAEDAMAEASKWIRAHLAAAPQPPATRSYADGIEAAAKWIESQIDNHNSMLEAYPGDPTGCIAREIEMLQAHAAAIRSLADEPRHGE